MGGHHLLLPTALQFHKKRRRYGFAPTQLRASRINWKERKMRGCERVREDCCRNGKNFREK
jgi:predicted RNA-binding protein with PUA domain